MAISHTFILFYSVFWFCRSNSCEPKHHLVYFLELTTQLIGDHLRSSPTLYLGLLEYRIDLTIAARTKRATRFSLPPPPILQGPRRYMLIRQNFCCCARSNAHFTQTDGHHYLPTDLVECQNEPGSASIISAWGRDEMVAQAVRMVGVEWLRRHCSWDRRVCLERIWAWKTPIKTLQRRTKWLEVLKW